MEISLPAKSVQIKIKQNSYTVPFPTTGQFIDISSMKSKLTENAYNGLATNGDGNSQYAKLLVDMIATFSILIPDLKKDMNVPSILGLSLFESKELLDVYNEQWLPFYSSWIEVLNNPKVDEMGK